MVIIKEYNILTEKVETVEEQPICFLCHKEIKGKPYVAEIFFAGGGRIFAEEIDDRLFCQECVDTDKVSVGMENQFKKKGLHFKT